MLKKKDIENYIDHNILDTIFRERKEELCCITNNKEDTQVKEIEKEYPTDYQKLTLIVKNLPPHFNNIRENILNALEDYRIREQLLAAYGNEKFYKIGFYDGIGLMLDSMKKQ